MWERISLQCNSCKYKWEGWQPTHCPVDTWVAHVKTYRCPGCGKGADTILLCANSPEEK